MKLPAISLFFGLLMSGNISYAQNSILAGKIVDQNNKPVSAAVIKISKNGVAPVEATSDKDGLYCSKLLACGSYNIVVVRNGSNMCTKELNLDERSGSKRFFLIKISGKKFTISPVDNDPSISVKLGEIEDAQKGLDYPARKKRSN